MKQRLPVIIFLAFLALLMTAAPVQALSVIRDDEIERFLRDVSRPIFEAAQLVPDSVSLVVVGNDMVNAYVAGGKNIFLYSGLIVKTENIDELSGVIAHETGHIAAGHLARSQEIIENAGIQGMLSTILGVAVAVGSGRPDAGIGVAMGGSEITKRQVLKNSRTFESSADQAAIDFLHQSGHSATGMASFLDKLAKQELLPRSQQMEYVMTHPLSQDRVAAVYAAIKDKDLPLGSHWSPEMQERYARVKAKLEAFLYPQRTYQLQRFEGDTALPDDSDVPALYARLIAAYRMGDVSHALDILSTLIRKEPENPYFYELKGQILFENSRIDEAVDMYKKAVSYAPDDAGLIYMAYGHALLEKREPGLLDKAISVLKKALQTEKTTPVLHRLLSIAYGRSGQEGLAKLHLAEEGFLKRDLAFAIQQANIAIQNLEEGTIPYQRAKDLLRLAEKKKI